MNTLAPRALVLVAALLPACATEDVSKDGAEGSGGVLVGHADMTAGPGVPGLDAFAASGRDALPGGEPDGRAGRPPMPRPEADAAPEPAPDAAAEPPPPPPPADLCLANTCSGRGWCVDGQCLCDPGYAGALCDVCDGIWIAAPGAGPLQCTPTIPIDGTEGDDAVLDGLAENEHVRGLGGSDHVRGMEGSDLVNGNQGDDFVNGNTGRDEVHGGSEDDEVMGGSEDDVVYGDLGNDRVTGGGGDDRLIGGDGNDTLMGSEGDDRYVLDGLGADVIDDSAGNDTARCLPGVVVLSDVAVGGDRLLTLSTGGTVRIQANCVEAILGCQ